MFFRLSDGPTIIIVDLYVESFGNIKEADMVGLRVVVFALEITRLPYNTTSMYILQLTKISICRKTLEFSFFL